MIKLKKPSLLKAEEPEKRVDTPKEKKSRKKGLPPDVYTDEFPPVEMPVDENRKFILSVKRGGELGLPMCDIRQFQTTEVYTGFTKKGVNFPVELLPDLIEYLQEVYNKCVEKEIL